MNASQPLPDAFESTGEQSAVRTFIPWMGKAALTVIDQGLFAGSNFILSVLLARWLTAQDYGAYGIGLTVFWMVATVHTGFLSEPMLVFGAKLFRDKFHSYTACLFAGHTLFALVLAVAFAVAGLIAGSVGNTVLAEVFYALAPGQFFILLLWMMRRACYVRIRPDIGVASGVVYALAMLPIAYALFTRQHLNAWTAIALTSAASCAAACCIAVLLHMKTSSRFDKVLLNQIGHNHWRYGRWAALSGLIMWLPEQLPFIVIGSWHGLEQTAVTKALWNFAMPVAHAYTALSVLMVPVFVRIRHKASFNRSVMMIAGGITLATTVYWIILGVFGPALLGLVYNGRYTEHSSSLWLVGAITTIAGILAVLSALLRAVERPNHIFWAYVGASVSCLSIGLVLMYRYAAAGAFISIIISSAVAAAMMLFFLMKQKPVSGAHSHQDTAICNG